MRIYKLQTKLIIGKFFEITDMTLVISCVTCLISVRFGLYLNIKSSLQPTFQLAC
jgi:hypothetical protein